ncbi:MAG: phage terminase small subunit [Marinobacterium sp.]|nr:phage terminase small subunit [Marinobacterium sp.]
MVSPAKRHFMKVTAYQESTAATANSTRPDAGQYELILAQLYEHRRQLKAIQSIQGKCQLKAQLLPEYEPYIEGVLEADSGSTDDVLTTVMIWRIDAGDWDGALQLATYTLKHQLTLPDRYQRTTACLITEEIAEAALKADAENAVPIAILQQLATLTEGEDMPDEVRAKLHKAIGLTLMETEPQQALNSLKLALNYHDRVGVKKEIERIERQLKKQTAPA